ncbi:MULTISPECIES: helix-turn-helix domain-containing protein [Staphylococcus]|uniref:helix-turn-helix domain-containing protein n=1 Tax=Staphylococcus TaxID=1279 RepID=UPI000D19C31F|nr:MULTISPECIES: helix-turn-helix transcriptional regulator [Staphylococcus]PTH38411.1 XRE family transcriptional regulator [Staphylococcus agnetis]PTH68871.1 XRE family transcriptional regulator [Staphylococcus agnetis]
MRTSSEIGKLVKSLRAKKGMSISEFADAIGVNKSTVSRYENGSRKIPMEDIAKFASVLGVKPDYLLLKEQKQEEPQHRAAHLEGELTDDEWQRVLDYADYIRSRRK